MAYMLSMVTLRPDPLESTKSGANFSEVAEIPGTLEQVRTALKNAKIKTSLGYPKGLEVKLMYIYFCKEGILCI